METKLEFLIRLDNQQQTLACRFGYSVPVRIEPSGVRVPPGKKPVGPGFLTGHQVVSPLGNEKGKNANFNLDATQTEGFHQRVWMFGHSLPSCSHLNLKPTGTILLTGYPHQLQITFNFGLAIPFSYQMVHYLLSFVIPLEDVRTPTFCILFTLSLSQTG